MKYYNPVVRGMYPDPSICMGEEKYYMVCSSFHLFPGVPLFESEDMVNWRQIGHCITRSSQIDLEGVPSSGGIFAPTIRYHHGRYYMVTTNDSSHRNFYVYTDNIYGEWSEPVFVEQGGIDPSLFFEGEDTYFVSNGTDVDGKGCIQICQIDIETGQKLSESRVLWKGTGGRYIEAPHLYHFEEYYYLIEAEGGTEYGHMVNCARSKTIMGEYESCPNNPLLTNRNLGGYQLQGAGHGDILEDKHGNWWFMHLAFRQIGRWETFHHLGRETCLEPLYWGKDGWPIIGTDGTARLEVQVPDSISFEKQVFTYDKTFENLDWKKDWCYLR
ncbi:MAG: glycoside hydrolase family 43 protein, partial [Lachnospiraceae bacterium]|nr:glycoside hydrolase family 43 protein [Lachnospiraceae bacterium]